MKPDQETMALIEEFESVLDSEKEQIIHEFIETHPRVLQGMFPDSLVKSKFPLGEAHIPDFLVISPDGRTNAIMPVIHFIEIERANGRLFTKSGDPTSFLTHAIRQVQDWKGWTTTNRNYLRQRLSRIVISENEWQEEETPFFVRNDIPEAMSFGFRSEYIVVAGRRHAMRMRDRMLLGQMNEDLQDIRIITYDLLLENLFRYSRYWGSWLNV